MDRAIAIFQKRPALPSAIALIAGIFLHRILPHQPGYLLIVSAISLAIALVLLRSSLAWMFLIVAMLSAGACLAQLDDYNYAQDEIAQFAGGTARLAWLEVHIDQPPRIFADCFERFRPAPPRQLIHGHVTAARMQDGWERCSGNVLMTTLEPHAELAVGQTIRVLGFLQQPSPAMNPGQIDWAEVCRRQRIGATIFVAHVERIEIISTDSFQPLQWIRGKARNLLAQGFSNSRSVDRALLMDSFLGDGDPMLRDVKESFRQVGASYLLVISGLHVAVVVGVIFLLCRLLRLRPRNACYVIMGCVALYGCVIVPGTPAMRAVVMCVAFCIALLMRRKVDGIHLLAMVAIVLLVVDPMDVYGAGFQMSFGIVLGLMYGTGPMRELFSRLKDPHLLVAESFSAPKGMWLWWRTIQRWLEGTLSVGVIAWATAMPLIAFHFSELNPWTILACLALAPMTFATLIAGMMKVILTLIFPWGATWWANGAACFAALLRHLAAIFASVPGSDLPTIAPPLWIVIIYYIALVAIFVPMPRMWFKPVLRFGSLGTCGIFACLPFFPTRQPQLKITLLSVGAGQCAVIETRGSDPVLFDVGSATVTDVDRSVLHPFLQHEGIWHLGWVVLSHGDYDHISGTEHLAEEHEIRQVFVSPHFRRHAPESYPAKHLLEVLDHEQMPPNLLTAGDHLPIDDRGATQVEVLWPPVNCKMNSNNCGLVLKLTCAGKSILFPADIQVDAQRELLKHPEQLKADILVAPHHGSSEATTVEFIKAVNPSMILSSNDNTLTRKQRDFEQMTGNVRLLRTHRTGAITITIGDEGQIEVETFIKK